MIEVMFIVILFIFVGVMTYETGILYYNVNAVSNSLKQAVWLAAGGAPDEQIAKAVQDADSLLLKSALFEHRADNFGVEVWLQPPGSKTEINIAPTQCDHNLTPGRGATDIGTTKSAYVWRAHGLNIRVGLTYRAGYVAPFFGASPTFIVNMPLSQSEPITARNDEDKDGLVDLYEKELFALESAGEHASWLPGRHRDNSASLSRTSPAFANATDDIAYDVDGDGIADTSGLADPLDLTGATIDTEAPVRMYDFDNDGITDALDHGQNLLRHPRIGGNPLTVCR